jgi:hypothetical protein
MAAPDNNNNNINSLNEAKRQAMTGQWRTPPLPAFASQQQGGQVVVTNNHAQQGIHHSVVSQQHQQHQQQHQRVVPGPGTITAPGPTAAMPPPSMPLPESTDDYAKALQEAYRRGAEAAARLQQQQQPVSSASCPNLQQFKGQPNDPTIAAALVPNPLAGLPPPQPMALIPVPHPHPPQQQHHHQPPAVPSTATSRSLSLPDMQSYAARAQAEEEKRKKRLARNRASARLRRLRKKNLVSTVVSFELMFVISLSNQICQTSVTQ